MVRAKALHVLALLALTCFLGCSTARVPHFIRSPSLADVTRSPTATKHAAAGGLGFLSLSQPQLKALYEATGNTLAPGQELKARLLIDSAVYGKSATTFHQHVDGVPETYTLVTLRSWNSDAPDVVADVVAVFGGFTRIAWSSFESVQQDPHAFLFAFKKPSDPSSADLVVSKSLTTVTIKNDMEPSVKILHYPSVTHGPKSGFNFGSGLLSFSDEDPQNLHLPTGDYLHSGSQMTWERNPDMPSDEAMEANPDMYDHRMLYLPRLVTLDGPYDAAVSKFLASEAGIEPTQSIEYGWAIDSETQELVKVRQKIFEWEYQVFSLST